MTTIPKDAIEDYIDGPFLETESFEETKPQPVWEITDDGAADWALDRIKRAEESLERIKANAAQRVKAAEAEAQRTREFFVPRLRLWAEQNKPAKGKTIKLFAGNLCWKNKAAGFNYLDDAATIAWAKVHLPDAVKTEEKLRRTEIATYAKATGEVPPGVERVPEEKDVFHVG